jgi:hypothetical protein
MHTGTLRSRDGRLPWIVATSDVKVRFGETACVTQQTGIEIKGFALKRHIGEQDVSNP